MIQGSEAWLQFRKSGIGASDAPILMGDSKYSTPYELWQRKLGLIEEQPQNSSMERGKNLERKVIELLDERGLFFIPGIVIHPNLTWCFASLDGIALNGGICEIKAINKKDHIGAINGKVPSQYKAQLAHQMFVCETDHVLYVSYYPGLEENELVMFDVYRDDKYINNLIEKETHFHNCMLNKKWEEFCSDGT